MHQFEIFCLRSGRTIILWLAVALAGFLLHPVLIKAPKPINPKGQDAQAITQRVNRYCFGKESDGWTCELYVRKLTEHVNINGFDVVTHDQIQTVAASPTVGAYERSQVDPMAPSTHKSPVWVKQAASVIDAAAQAAGLAGQPLE